MTWALNESLERFVNPCLIIVYAIVNFSVGITHVRQANILYNGQEVEIS